MKVYGASVIKGLFWLAVAGLLFFAARILNAASHIAAAWLAQRIGLINTMVFTHIPSSLLLATVPFMPSFPIAAALFLAREGLVEIRLISRKVFLDRLWFRGFPQHPKVPARLCLRRDAVRMIEDVPLR